MHTDQRGAAHINVFYFLIMLVLFLGALGFAYVTLDRNTELETRANAAQAELTAQRAKDRLFQHYLEDLSKQLGEVGEYAGRANFSYEGNPPPLQNVVTPDRVTAAMNDFASAIGVPPTRELGALFGLVKAELDKHKEIARNLESQKAVLENQVAELQSAAATARTEAKRLTDQLNAQIRQRTEDYTASENDLRNNINQVNAEVSRVREEMSNTVAEHAVVVAGLRKELETLGARIDAAADKVKLINPSEAPDGMVIDASEATGLAWINLGRRDQLPVGTTFEIVKAGTNQVKAYGVVSRLEQSRAEIRITGVKDRFDPVAQGDMVRNDLYSPEMRHNIYLMGRFSPPFTRPMVQQLLENLGNRVHDELGPGVDLVILGGNTINEETSGFTPLTETEEYKLAQFLRIEMAPLSKVRQYLKLTDDMLPAR